MALVLALLVAGSAAAVMGRYPKSGIRRSAPGVSATASSSSSLWDSMIWDADQWG